MVLRHIGPGSAVEGIVAGSANEPITSDATAMKRIGILPTAEPVVAFCSDEFIGAHATADPVVAGTPIDQVIATVAAEVVVAGPTADDVVAATPLDGVVTGETGDDVAAGSADQSVIARCANNGRGVPMAHRFLGHRHRRRRGDPEHERRREYQIQSDYSSHATFSSPIQKSIPLPPSSES